MAYSPQALEMIKRCKNIPKGKARRQSFKRFWRKFTAHRDKPRYWRRFIAKQVWLAQKPSSEKREMLDKAFMSA